MKPCPSARCGLIWANGWLITSGRPTFVSLRAFPETQWVKSCGASCGISFQVLEWAFSMMDLAWLSLAALVLVIVLSCTTKVNPGFLSLALAWVIGVYLAPAWGRRFTIGEVL